MSKWPRFTGLALFLGLYFGCLAYLLTRQALWVDEILTLIGEMKPNWGSFIAYIRTLPGNTPVGFWVMGVPIRVAGYSIFTARVSSALFSVAGCVGLFLLARRLGLRRPLLAVLLFAACPLQFRYAIEARPYAMVLCLSIWSTVVFLDLLRSPGSWTLAVLYAVLAVLEIYTSSYAVFVPVAHFLWLLVSPRTWKENRRVMAICGVSVFLAGLSVIPWYLLMRQDWATHLTRLRIGSFLDGHPVSVVAHELIGAGYFGTALITLGVVLGLRRRVPALSFWIGYIVFPAALAVSADLVFGYFLAVRQMIFVLPPLVLLFAAGAETLDRKSGLLVGVFLAASLYADFRWFVRPREDWQAAASAVARLDACVTFVPRDTETYYLFYRPELRARECVTQPDSLALAIGSWDPERAYETARRGLLARGLSQKSRQDFSGPRVELYAK